MNIEEMKQKRQMTQSILARALIDLRDRQIQKARIQFSNRLSAINNGADDDIYKSYIVKWSEYFKKTEKDLDAAILDLSMDFPIVDYMCKVKGVGMILSMKVVVMIDIKKADTISKLWRYAGFGIVDGEREKPTKGEKLHYNKRLKSTCYLIGTSFLKSKSPYREIYDEAKAYYQSNRPNWTKDHIHKASMRKMIKIWLAHLWLVWRKLENLETRDPYIAMSSKYHRIYTPEEFGW